jgi:hypothetical protein
VTKLVAGMKGKVHARTTAITEMCHSAIVNFDDHTKCRMTDSSFIRHFGRVRSFRETSSRRDAVSHSFSTLFSASRLVVRDHLCRNTILARNEPLHLRFKFIMADQISYSTVMNVCTCWDRLKRVPNYREKCGELILQR